MEDCPVTDKYILEKVEKWVFLRFSRVKSETSHDNLKPGDIVLLRDK